MHDQLLWEYVNEKVFEEHIKVKFASEEEHTEVPELTTDDLNALRYAAGYVICKITSVSVPTSRTFWYV